MNFDSFWGTIRQDRSRGSSELLTMTLDRLEGYLSNLKNDTQSDLSGLVESLKSVRPEMSLLVNAGHLLESELTRNNHVDVRAALLDRVRSIRSKLGESPERIARNLKELDSPLNQPLIFSRSGTVLDTLSHRENVEQVHVLESRPGEEGLDISNELQDLYEVTFYYDLEALRAFKNSDGLLLGADSFGQDGYLRNKTGTHLLARACEKIPVISCFQTLKYEPELSESSRPTVESPDSLSEKLRRSHSLFECIPPEVIDWFVTERGAARNSSELRSQIEELQSLHN